VLSNGRPQLRADAEPDAFARVRRLGEALGVDVETYDGALERAWLADSGNAARAAARAASDDETQVTLYVGPRIRGRLGAQALPQGIDTEAFDLGALGPVRAPSLAEEPLAEAALALARRAGAVELAALRRAAPGAVVTLLRDDVLGTRWLSVGRCPGCGALIVPLGEGSPTPLTGADPVAALALGAGRWVVE
jgi:hypothetical protein